MVVVSGVMVLAFVWSFVSKAFFCSLFCELCERLRIARAEVIDSLDLFDEVRHCTAIRDRVPILHNAVNKDFRVELLKVKALRKSLHKVRLFWED